MPKKRGRGMASVNYPTGMNLGGDPSQALVHAKSMLFIDYQQDQVFKFNVILKLCMCADDDLAPARTDKI